MENFDENTWRQRAKKKLAGLKDWFGKGGAPQFTYGFLGALSLWPLVDAAAKAGGALPVSLFIAMGSVLGNVGANLVAEQVQRWKDRADDVDEAEVVRWVDETARNNIGFRDAVDTLIEKMDAFPVAMDRMEEDLRKRFLDTLREEMRGMGNLARFEAKIDNSLRINVIGDYATLNINVATDEFLKGVQPRRLSESRFRETAKDYLSHLGARYRYLDFKGMGVFDKAPLRIELLDMYVPLKARIELPEGETWARQLRVAGKPVGDQEEEAMGRRVSEPQSLLELLEKNDVLVILGDPGAGKTTFLKYLTLLLAGGKGDELGLGRRVPVLVPLSAYATAMEAGDVPLKEFIGNYYRGRNVDLPVGTMLDEALEQGAAMVLLDGLDEVQAAKDRQVVVERIEDFCSFHRNKGAKFVLTSRIIGYREVRPYTIDGLKECTLVDFEREDIELFVKKWTLAIEKAARDHEGLARQEAEKEEQELLRAVERNPGVSQLASNPLLLTILALMKRQGVSLPERRVQLYDQYVKTLIRHWNLARGLDKRSGCALDDVDTIRMLAPLALWMHTRSATVGIVPRAALCAELMRLLRLQCAEDPEKEARAFLDSVRTHTALLLERGQGAYGFIHLTFQEYLAAVAVADLGQVKVEPVADILEKHLDDPVWNEVSCLSVAYTGIVQGRDVAASDILKELIRRQPDKGAVLAGKIVRDAWPGGIRGDCRDEVRKALVRSLEGKNGAPAKQRAEAGAALGRIGDPRKEIMTLEDMLFCYVPGGDFMMGEKGEDGWKLHRNACLKNGYWIGKYPVTQRQFAFFVEDGGYDETGYWVEAREHGYWNEKGFKGRWESEPRKKPLSLKSPFHLPNHPAVGVTWYEALAFTRWLTEKWNGSGLMPRPWKVMLPSEAEWEKAARGGIALPERETVLTIGKAVAVHDSLENGPVLSKQNQMPERAYPWGDHLTPELANIKESQIGSTCTPGCFSGGQGPYGCQDMSGNVYDWTRSIRTKYPYDPSDGRELSKNVKKDSWIILRGGGFWNGASAEWLRCGARFNYYPNYHDDSIGFRMSAAPFTSEL